MICSQRYWALIRSVSFTSKIHICPMVVSVMQESKAVKRPAEGPGGGKGQL